MIGALSNALSGLTTASKQAESAASNIAKSTTVEGDTVELSEEAVNLILAETNYKANIATIQTAQELNDELLRLFDKTV